MRSILLFAVLAATIPLLSNGQTEPKPKPTAPASPQTGATEQALTKLDRELMDAVVRKDRTLFDRTALTRFVFVNPGGGIEERTDSMEGGPNIESIQTDNVVVRVDGDTAVLTGKANLKGKLALKVSPMALLVRRPCVGGGGVVPGTKGRPVRAPLLGS